MIKTIIFDYGGVLGEDADSWASMYHNIVEKTGLEQKTIDAIWSKHQDKMLVGKENLIDFFTELSSVAKNKTSADELMNLYFEDTIANQEALKFVKELKQQGHKLLLLSNETKEGITNKIEKFKLNDLFEKIYCSAFMGMKKKEPRAFEIVIKEQKINPKETLFIDDRKHNVDVARTFGIYAIHFKTLQDLKAQVKSVLR